MAKLTYAKRKRMKASSFVFPRRKTRKNPAGEGAYPIPDLAHARNALARVAQHGTPAEKAAVRRKVYRKFPSLKKKGRKK